MTTPQEQLVRAGRDRRIRRNILAFLHQARDGTYGMSVTGHMLDNLFGPHGIGETNELAESQKDLLKLIGDLVDAGLVRELDERGFKHQPRSIDYLSYEITSTGVQLIELAIDPHPLVEDPRPCPRK